MSALFRLLSGVLLLILGRSLFWLFAAATGFLTGAAIASRVFQTEPAWIVLAVAMAVGVLGALLALVLPRAIGALVGFWAGGYLALSLLRVLDLNMGDLTWLPVLVGGIIGAVTVLSLFDWALIVLSSLAGAVTIADVLVPHGLSAVLVTAVLFLVGVMIQAGLWHRRVRSSI